MAIGTGHRSNNYSESKRNDHLDNNRRQEQRNKGIPNKSHPNFREEHKSFSSIFVSNIPWNASVQDLWDICNKWGVVIDVYIAAKRSKSGHRFGFVRFINVNDINQLVSNLRTAWMGGFHLFADVAKYGRTYNRPVERSGDGKPSVGSNSQSVSINENVFQSFNSYAKAVLDNKSVDMSGKYGTSNAGAESVGVSDCNKVYKEAVMSISVDDRIDLDGMERSILAKVKDLSVISELLKHMSSEGFDDVGLRYVGGRHRSNNYSESKRNDHLDNNRRQEQRNKGIPNKSHPNFREEHKSFSSIFVSNIPWNASVQDLWDICNKWGVVIDVYIAAKRSKSGHRFGFVRFINVNDINQLVSNLRTAWMGGFHLFADVAKYGRTYNRPVERSGDGKPSVGSNSQSVSINENVFQSFNSYAKAVLGNKSVDMSGKYGTSNAGAESVGVSDCNKVYKEAGNEAVMSISVDDCIDLDGMERSILAKVKDLSVISELLKHMSSEGFDDVGLRYVGGRWVWLEFDSMDQVESVKTSKALKEIFLEFKDVSHDFIPDERCVWIDLVGLPLASWAPEVYKKLGGRWGSSVFTDMVSDGPMSHGKVCVLTESLHRVIESFIVSYRNRTYRIIATEFAYWAPNIESMEVNSESNPLERKDAEGPSLDESLENEEHLDVDSCDSDSPKNVNNDSVSPSSRVLREEDVRGVESDLVDSFEEGEIRDDSVLYNDGCIKDCMEKNLEDDAGEILGVHSQGDCGNVTTDDNEDVTPVIAPEKDSIIAPPSTPPGNDLNIAAESGSSWIDYIGPLTSDEIDSDKRWSYRDPNGNIHGLFSLAQLRSWKDYFPSDLQIWSYYGNVKEAILLHNALSRQTKDAG
ncbi:RNA-directed DNA polymerase, eukaryota [Tanacetum coccineum]